MRKCLRCHEEVGECFHYQLCSLHRSLVPCMCDCLKKKEEAPVLVRVNTLPIEAEPPKLEEVIIPECPTAPPPSPEEIKKPTPLEIVDEEVEHSISLALEDEIDRMKTLEEEKERQQEQLMIKLRESYEQKMKQLQEEKEKVDQMIQEAKREEEIKKKIQENQKIIEKIKSQKKQSEKSDIFARLSSGKSSVTGEKAQLLGKKNSLRRSS